MKSNSHSEPHLRPLLRLPAPSPSKVKDQKNSLAIKRGMAYNCSYKPSCKEPFKLIPYARKNSKRLLCGLFCISIKAEMEVKMVIALDRGRGKGGMKEIKVEGEREKGKEVIVRHEIVSSKWKKWNDENFSRVRNKNYSV
jgi:hypothetical protein